MVNLYKPCIYHDISINHAISWYWVHISNDADRQMIFLLHWQHCSSSSIESIFQIFVFNYSYIPNHVWWLCYTPLTINLSAKSLHCETAKFLTKLWMMQRLRLDKTDQSAFLIDRQHGSCRYKWYVHLISMFAKTLRDRYFTASVSLNHGNYSWQKEYVAKYELKPTI